MRISDEAAERVRKLFQITSHPIRIALLDFLENSKGTYYNLIKSWFYHIPDSTLRFHLKKLIDVRFIAKSGKEYTITDTGKRVLKFSREFEKAMAEFK